MLSGRVEAGFEDLALLVLPVGVLADYPVKAHG